KGNHANVAVIAYTQAGYDWLRTHLTVEGARDYFAPLRPSGGARFEAPNLLALNFVLDDVLAGGPGRSLRAARHGKTLGRPLLRMKVERRANLEAMAR